MDIVGVFHEWLAKGAPPRTCGKLSSVEERHRHTNILPSQVSVCCVEIYRNLGLPMPRQIENSNATFGYDWG